MRINAFLLIFMFCTGCASMFLPNGKIEVINDDIKGVKPLTFTIKQADIEKIKKYLRVNPKEAQV